MTEEVETSQAEPVGPTETNDTQAPDTPTLDANEYSNHRVSVKSNGEELQVPLSEAIAGYQRQSDYTRKTQELSQQRDQFQFASALQTALDSDPQGTLKLLAGHYGLDLGSQSVPDIENDIWSEPADARYSALDKRIASFEEAQNQQIVAREVQGLQDKYSDFDVKEVVTAALRADSTDLEGIYKQLAYDKIVAKGKLDEGARNKQKQADDSVLDAKRAANVVSGGSSATSSTTSESITPIRSVSEAWAAAKLQMGAN